MAFFIAVTVLLSHADSRADGRKLRVGVYQNRPLVFHEGARNVGGICIDVLEYVAEREGWELEYIPGTVTELEEDIQKGAVDLLVGAEASRRRRKNFDLNRERLLISWTVVYSHKDGGLASIRDLDGKRVAVVRGDVYYDRLKYRTYKLNLNPEFIEANNYGEVMALVREERADAGVVSWFFSEMHGLEYGLKRTSIVFGPVGIFFATRKGEGDEVLPTLDRYIRELKNTEGSFLQKALDHWRIGTDRGLPRWLIPYGVFGAVVVAVLIASALFLRGRVRERTRELRMKNRDLVSEIEDRKRIEEALRGNEERYRALFEFSPAVTAIVDLDGKILNMNEAGLAIIGLKREEVIGREFTDFETTRKQTPRLDGIYFRLTRGEKVGPFEMTITPAGETEPRLLEVYPSLLGIKEKPVAIQVIAIDVTKRAEAERQIRQMQKMDAIETLAGGVAHDFNNLLTGILGYANMLKMNLVTGEQVEKAADVIERAAERASQLTMKLLGFARLGKYQTVPVNVNNVILGVTEILERAINENIRITKRLSKDPLISFGDPNQLEHVVLNLALNARDAMPDGGEITFESGVVVFDKKYCETHPEAAPGSYVVISVMDGGHGIPKDIQERIFEPFFTTRNKGEWSGMGLPMVYGIVKNHGGFAQVHSEEGEGTILKIYLPLEEPSGSVTEEAPGPGSFTAGG